MKKSTKKEGKMVQKNNDEKIYRELKGGYWASTYTDIPTDEEITEDKRLLKEFKDTYSKQIERTTAVYKKAAKEKRTASSENDLSRWLMTWEQLEVDDIFRHRVLKGILKNTNNTYEFLAPYWQESVECVGRDVSPLYCNFCKKDIKLAKEADICPFCGTMWHFELFFD